MNYSAGYFISFLSILLFFNASIFGQNPEPYFKNFTTDQGLPSPEVHCILQDSDGYMWFGTDNGVSKFDGYTFINYSVSDGLNHPVIFGLQEDNLGRIWMRTLSGNLYYFLEGRIYPYIYNHIIQEFNKSDLYVLTDFYISKDGFIYADIRLFGVLKIDAQGAYELVDRIDKPKNNVRQYSVKSSSQNDTLSSSVLNLNDTIFQSISIDYNYAYIDANHEILIALPARKGLRKYKNLENLKKGQFDQMLEGVSVSYIYQDLQNNYWIASLEKGVFYCSNFNINVYTRDNGFANELFSAITFKNEHEVFVGLRSGETYLLNTVTQELTALAKNEMENRVFDLVYDRSNQLLWMPGHCYYYYQGNRWNPILAKHKIKFESILTKELFLGTKSQILWGSGAKGFLGVDLKTKKFAHRGFESLGKSVKNRTQSVYEDFEQNIWIGNMAGLFNYKDKSLIAAKDPKGLFTIRVEDIDQMKDSTLVVGTKGAGVVLWKDDEYAYLSTQEGLNSNMIEHIHVDEKDRIWVGTLSGLSLITKDLDRQFSVKPFTMAHGLPSNEINVINSIGDHIWVGTSKGMVHFIANDFVAPNPQPILEKTIINNEPKDIENGIQLKSKENNIQFSFLTINYPLSGSINYRYRLQESLNWTTTRARTANFLTLPPDDYQFELQAQNQNGDWSESTKIDFSIQQPFWKTKAFILIAFCLIVGFVYSLYKYRINQIIYKTQIDRKIDRLERSALKAQMNPHFIFNCLNSIQAFITDGNRKDAADYLARFAQLIRSTLNFSSSGFAVLSEEIDALKNYLALEQMRFKDRFQYTINIDSNLNPQMIKVPNLLVQPFVENAVIHGIASRKKGGLVQIFYRLNQKYLEVTIRDNGQGFHQKFVRSTDKPKVNIHKSVGMSITQRRLELLNQESKEKGVEIKEIKDAENQTLGTEVQLKIKVLDT